MLVSRKPRLALTRAHRLALIHRRALRFLAISSSSIAVTRVPGVIGFQMLDLRVAPLSDIVTDDVSDMTSAASSTVFDGIEVFLVAGRDR